MPADDHDVERLAAEKSEQVLAIRLRTIAEAPDLPIGEVFENVFMKPGQPLHFCPIFWVKTKVCPADLLHPR